MKRQGYECHWSIRWHTTQLYAVGSFALAIVLAHSALFGQTAAAPAHDETPNQKIVGPIHRLTTSARTVNDYTTIIDRCAETMDHQELAVPDRDYLKRLASWAYNRRCESRMEAAEYFRDSGLEAEASSNSDEALGDAIEALELDPTRWRAWVNRGVLLAHAGMLDAALADFQRATQLETGTAMSWFNAAEALFGLARYCEAVGCYDQALSIDAGDLQSLTGRGLCRLQMGQADRALEDFAVVVKMMPGNAAALVNRGDAQQALGQWRAAYDDYVAAAQLDSNGPATHRAAWLLATCPEAELFRPHAAKDLALKSLATGAASVARLEALAAACAALGEFEMAVAKQTEATESASGEQRRACQQRLELYSAEKPFRQAATSTSSSR